MEHQSERFVELAYQNLIMTLQFDEIGSYTAAEKAELRELLKIYKPEYFKDSVLQYISINTDGKYYWSSERHDFRINILLDDTRRYWIAYLKDPKGQITSEIFPTFKDAILWIELQVLRIEVKIKNDLLTEDQLKVFSKNMPKQ